MKSALSAVWQIQRRCHERVNRQWRGHRKGGEILTVMLAHILQSDGASWASKFNIARPVDISQESACKWMGKLEADG